MRIAVGHRSSGLCASVRRSSSCSQRLGHEVEDDGNVHATRPSIIPTSPPGWRRKVSRGEADRGILICGTGLGMCIAANKFPGVRAAPCHDDLTAEMSRRHNDSNILCLSADLLGRTADRPHDRTLAEHALRRRPARPAGRQNRRDRERSRGGAGANARLAVRRRGCDRSGQCRRSRQGTARTPRPNAGAALPVRLNWAGRFAVAATPWGGCSVRSGLGPRRNRRRRPDLFMFASWKILRPWLRWIDDVTRSLVGDELDRELFSTDSLLHASFSPSQSRMKSTSCCATPSCATNWNATSTNRSAA